VHGFVTIPQIVIAGSLHAVQIVSMALDRVHDSVQLRLPLERQQPEKITSGGFACQRG
jgi:hypothetical protein